MASGQRVSLPVHASHVGRPSRTSAQRFTGSLRKVPALGRPGLHGRPTGPLASEGRPSGRPETVTLKGLPPAHRSHRQDEALDPPVAINGALGSLALT